MCACYSALIFFVFALMMNIACWNCRGAGSRTFPLMVKEIVKKNEIGVFCIIEPRISGLRADRMVRRLGFTNWIRLEASGFSGGIWVLWNAGDFDIELVTSNEQFLLCSIKCLSINKEFHGLFVYGETNYKKRNSLWQAISHVAKNINGPLFLAGDFNAYRKQEDKKGGAMPNH